MNTFHLLLLSLLFLSGCTNADPPMPLSQSGPAAHDRWQLTVGEEGGEAAIQRQLTMNAELTRLLRGSPAADPLSVAQILKRQGAAGVRCSQADQESGIQITCLYRKPLSPAETSKPSRITWLALPDSRPLALAAGLPVETAESLTIETDGRITVPGLLLKWPAAQNNHYPNGGYHVQNTWLRSLSESTVTEAMATQVMATEVMVNKKMWIPPGNLPPEINGEADQIAFTQNYLPTSAAWLALLFALVAALLAIFLLLPLRARLPGKPRLWQPRLDRYPVFLRWLVRLLASAVNWLKLNWPAVLNGLISLTLIAWGGQILLASWSAARISGLLSGLAPSSGTLFTFLPLGDLLQLLGKPGGLILWALFGAVLVATGIGLLARWQAARLLLLTALLALTLGVILFWPRIILSPSRLPMQLELILFLGGSMLFLLVFLCRWITHPYFRRYYLQMTES